jgi:hypothetical protein
MADRKAAQTVETKDIRRAAQMVVWTADRTAVCWVAHWDHQLVGVLADWWAVNLAVCWAGGWVALLVEWRGRQTVDERVVRRVCRSAAPKAGNWVAMRAEAKVALWAAWTALSKAGRMAGSWAVWTA